MVGRCKERRHVRGHHGPNILNLLNIISAGSQKLAELPEMLRKGERRGLSYVPNSERKQEPRQRRVPALVDGLHQLRRRFLTHPFQLGKLLESERVHIVWATYLGLL